MGIASWLSSLGIIGHRPPKCTGNGTLILLYLYKGFPEVVANQENFVPRQLNIDDHNYLHNSIYGDCYITLVQRWIDLGYINQAKAIAIRYPRGHKRYSEQGIIRISDNFDVYILPNIWQYHKVHSPSDGDILFIRGVGWEPVIDQHSHSFRIFYCGYSVDRWKPPWVVDIVLIDDPARRLWRTRCVEFFKCCDENVFRPLPLDKEYDLCFIARFDRHDKKGQLEFARLADKSWRAIFMGELGEPSAVEELKRVWPSCEVIEALPKAQVNEVLNKSKVSVVFSQSRDAVPRVIVESMASGTPVIVHERNIGRKYITPKAGMISSSSRFRKDLGSMIQFHDRYAPRDEYMKYYSSAKVARRLWEQIFG